MTKGGLSYLNKKKYHPGSIRNMEEVYRREQRYIGLIKQNLKETEVALNALKPNASRRMSWMLPDSNEKTKERLLGSALTSFVKTNKKKSAVFEKERKLLERIYIEKRLKQLEKKSS